MSMPNAITRSDPLSLTLSQRERGHQAFTLIELLIVMAILGILLSFVFVKTRPLYHLGNARKLARNNDALQIERAMTQALIDNLSPPQNIPYGADSAKWICQYTYQGVECMNPPIEGVDLSYLVPTYIPTIPVNPVGVAEGVTGFKIYRDGAFFIVVPIVSQGSSSSSSG